MRPEALPDQANGMTGAPPLPLVRTRALRGSMLESQDAAVGLEL